jgi:MYXO-CTERM domain-containing protein
MRGARALLAAMAVAAALAMPAVAEELAPAGAPQPDRTVRDREFGVTARHFGLERRVEMLQWQAASRGYERVWSERPIDSAGFAPGHANPPFPLQGQRWLARAVSVDGHPLDPTVLERLGVWRDFRPSFSALPGNLAVTFQPQGDGLGSADNPLAPQVGDLRIHWRELLLPPLDARVVLREGRWQLAAPQPDPVQPAGATTPEPKPRLPVWMLGGALVVLVAALAARRRRRQQDHRNH